MNSFEMRTRQIKGFMDDKTLNPYPHKFDSTLVPASFHEKYAHLKRGETMEKEEIRLGARIMNKRELG